MIDGINLESLGHVHLESVESKKSGNLEDMDTFHSDSLRSRGYYLALTGVRFEFEIQLPMYLANKINLLYPIELKEYIDEELVAPKLWHIPKDTSSVHQSTKQQYMDDLEISCNDCYKRYQAFKESGVSEELSRIFLHTNHLSSYHLNSDFVELVRMAVDALNNENEELNIVGHTIYKLIFGVFPKTMNQFCGKNA